MKVLIIGIGSRGDVQPLTALALGLRARGHEVLLCAPPNFGAWAKQLELPFLPVGIDVMEWLRDRPGAATRPLATIREANRFFVEQLDQQFEELGSVVPGFDLIVGTGLLLAARSLADLHGIPYRCVAYSPQLAPTRRYPTLMIPFQKLPGWLNLLSHKMTRWMFRLAFGRKLNAKRRQLELPPIRSIDDAVLSGYDLVACDPLLAPLPDDVSEKLEQVGALLMSSSEPLLDELDRWLDAGSPPVYLGFGSMPDEHPEKTRALLLEVAESLDLRIVWGLGWSAQTVGSSDRLFVLESAPFGSLFPRTAAVVHHGGAGTVATAARAGVPQIIVPHLLDQFFWGQRLWEAGLGPKPIPKRRLNHGRLGQALRECLQETRFQETAAEVAMVLRKTDPVGKAVAVLEGCVSERRSERGL